MTILLRTCGGVGNQLFQSNFAILIASRSNNAKIYHLHSTNYKRVAKWELDFFNFLPARNFHFLIILLRLPRLLVYLKVRKKEFICIGNFFIVDGYFLEKCNYEEFSKNEIEGSIDYLRRFFSLKRRKNNNTLLHVRLGDFFNSYEEKEFYLRHIVGQVDEKVVLITNEEDFLMDILNNNFESKLEMFEFLSTASLSSIEVLELATEYDIIWYNGSTLLFWSSVLGSSALVWNTNLSNKHYVVKNCIQLDELKRLFSPVV